MKSKLTEKDISEVTGGKIVFARDLNRKKRKPIDKKPRIDEIKLCPKCGQTRLSHRVCTNCGYIEDDLN